MAVRSQNGPAANLVQLRIWILWSISQSNPSTSYRRNWKREICSSQQRLSWIRFWKTRQVSRSMLSTCIVVSKPIDIQYGKGKSFDKVQSDGENRLWTKSAMETF